MTSNSSLRPVPELSGSYHENCHGADQEQVLKYLSRYTAPRSDQQLLPSRLRRSTMFDSTGKITRIVGPRKR